MNQTKVTCPNCKTEIDINDVLTHQLEEDLNRKFQEKITQEKKAFEEKERELDRKNQEFELRKKKENELFIEKFNQKIKEEKELLERSIKQRVALENEDYLKNIQKELNEKSEQIKELNKSKAEVERLKREKEEIKEKVEAETQRKMNEFLAIEKEKIQKSTSEKHDLKVKELEKQLQDQKRLTEEMQRKQEQGSMQLQGEVQEIAIEEELRSYFPYDIISEVAKGVRGADCLQTVRNALMQDCGKIIYESKRTKAFSAEWIVKLKDDMRIAGADIAVLVTQTLPKDQAKFSLVNGVYVCSYDEYKNLAVVLREGIMKVHAAQASNQNKGDKMHMLYDFLTGSEFRRQVEAIIEGFSILKEDLDKEKRAMMQIWKKREKQIEKVILNTTEMYGSVKGIAGSSIQPIQSLEMPNDYELPDELFDNETN